MVYNFCWRANIMQRRNDEIVNRRNLRKLFKQDKICEIALKKKLLFSPLTYLITNSLTRSYLTRPDGCIAKVLLNTRWTGLKIQVRRKPPPHLPTELWLVCRELVENLKRG